MSKKNINCTFFVTIVAECVNSVVKRLVLHQVQKMQDIVQLFLDIYDLQNQFRDAAFINQGDFKLVASIRCDGKLSKEFVLERAEYYALSSEEQKAKRMRFCMLKPPKPLKSLKAPLMASSDSTMIAPIRLTGGKKPGVSRPSGSKTVSFKSKKVTKIKRRDLSDESNVLDCLTQLDFSESEDEEDADEVEKDDGNASAREESKALTLREHSIFHGNNFSRLSQIGGTTKDNTFLGQHTSTPIPKATNMPVGNTSSKPKVEETCTPIARETTVAVQEETALVTEAAAVVVEEEISYQEVPLQVKRIDHSLRNVLSLVQYQNVGTNCWANAPMVVLRFCIQKSRPHLPKYDEHGQEVFPKLYVKKFNEFIWELAGLTGNYVVESMETVMTVFLDQYFSGREEITFKLATSHNEPGNFFFVI